MKSKIFILIMILIFLSCSKGDKIDLCDTKSRHSPYAEKWGIEKNGNYNRITFKLNGFPYSLNCPELSDDYYFAISYLILPDNYYGLMHWFRIGIIIPNYPTYERKAILRFNLYEFKGAGKYPLEHQFLPSGRENISEMKIDGDSMNPYYYVQRRSYGWLDIQEFDSKTFKIKGTFELDLVNDINYSDTIKIREGVFDGGFTLIR